MSSNFEPLLITNLLKWMSPFAIQILRTVKPFPYPFLLSPNYSVLHLVGLIHLNKNLKNLWYNSIIALAPSSVRSKLALLRSYLTGYVLQLISHLSLEDNNYEIAVSLLIKEFLDVSFIINEIFKQVKATTPKYDFTEVRVENFLQAGLF